MRAGIDPRSGSSMARDSRDTARMRPQHGTVLERKGPKEALLAAAASDNLQVALDILSLVEDPERKAVLVAQTLAIAAKNGCEVVCKGLVDMCRQQDLGSVRMCHVSFYIWFCLVQAYVFACLFKTIADLSLTIVRLTVRLTALSPARARAPAQMLCFFPPRSTGNLLSSIFCSKGAQTWIVPTAMGLRLSSFLHFTARLSKECLMTQRVNGA